MDTTNKHHKNNRMNYLDLSNHLNHLSFTACSTDIGLTSSKPWIKFQAEWRELISCPSKFPMTIFIADSRSLMNIQFCFRATTL